MMGRSDPVQQRGKPIRVHRLPLGGVAWKRAEGRDERIEHARIVASDRPLPMPLSGFVGKKDLLAFLIGELRTHRAENIGIIRRAAVAGAVHNKHRVSRFRQTLCPTRPPIRGIHPFSSLYSTAVYQNDRVRLRHGIRRFPIYVHRTALEVLSIHFHPFARYPKATVTNMPGRNFRPKWRLFVQNLPLRPLFYKQRIPGSQATTRMIILRLLFITLRLLFCFPA